MKMGKGNGCEVERNGERKEEEDDERDDKGEGRNKVKGKETEKGRGW